MVRQISKSRGFERKPLAYRVHLLLCEIDTGLRYVRPNFPDGNKVGKANSSNFSSDNISISLLPSPGAIDKLLFVASIVRSSG